MANNFQRRDQGDTAHLPRSGHSLSYAYAFTAACGQLLPTFWDYAFPGDKYSIKTDFDLSRALPLLQPASLDIEVCTDYFFVPMELLRLDFGEVYYGTNSVFSTAANSNFGAGLPTLRMYRDGLMLNRFKRGLADFEGLGKSVFRLLDMFGYNPLLITPQTSENSYYPQTIFSTTRPQYEESLFFNLLAYQAIYQYYYRDEEHETFDPSYFNIDDLRFNQHRDTMQDNVADQAIEGTKALHYLRLRYVNRRSDYFTDVFRSALLTANNLSRYVDDFGKDQFGLHSWLSDNLNSPVAVDHRGVIQNSSNTNTSVGSDFGTFDSDVDSVPNAGDSALMGVLNTAGLRAMFAQEKLLRITAAAKKNYDDQTLAHFGIRVPHDVKHQITHFGRNVMKYKVSEVVSTAQTLDGDKGAPLGEQAGRLYGANVNKKFAEFKAPVHGVVMGITFVRPAYHYIVPKLRLNMYKGIGDFWKPAYDHIGPQPIFRDEVQFNYAQASGEFAQPVVGWQYRYTENKSRFNRASMAFAGGTYNAFLNVTTPWSHTWQGHPVVDKAYSYSWIDNSSTASFKVSPHDTDGIFGKYYTDMWQVREDEMDHFWPSLDDYLNDNNIINVIGQRYFDQLRLSHEHLAQGRKNILKNYFFSQGDFDSCPYEIYDSDPFVLNAQIKCNKVSAMSKNSLPKLDM